MNCIAVNSYTCFESAVLLLKKSDQGGLFEMLCYFAGF